jgi:hypothetical protein
MRRCPRPRCRRAMRAARRMRWRRWPGSISGRWGRGPGRADAMARCRWRWDRYARLQAWDGTANAVRVRALPGFKSPSLRRSRPPPWTFWGGGPDSSQGQRLQFGSRLHLLEGAVEVGGGQEDVGVAALGHHLDDGAALVVGDAAARRGRRLQDDGRAGPADDTRRRRRLSVIHFGDGAAGKDGQLLPPAALQVVDRSRCRPGSARTQLPRRGRINDAISGSALLRSLPR